MLFLAALFILYIGRSAIPMVIVAALIALFIDPVIKFMIRRFKIKPGLAIGITYLFVTATLILIPLLVMPSIVDAAQLVTEIDLQEVSDRLIEVVQSISVLINSNPVLAAPLGPSVESILTMLENFGSTAQADVQLPPFSITDITSQVGRALGLVVSFLGPTVSALMSIVFTLLMSLQMTLVGDKIHTWYADLIPPGYGPELARLLKNIRQIWTGFLRGQMTLMLVVGLLAWLGATLLGLPQALFLGIIAGVLELIPNVGPILATIPAVVLALLFGSSYLSINHFLLALLVVGLYVIIQMIENQFLVPKIMGDAVDLPPLVVLIGTIAGAGAFGILGALLATPFIATGNIIFRYAYGKIMEQPLAQPLVEEQQDFVDTAHGFLSRVRWPFTRRGSAAQPKDTQKPIR